MTDTANMEPTETPESKSTPPWEKNGEEFNAERAWTFIQNKETELKTERKKHSETKAALKAAEEAKAAAENAAASQDAEGKIKTAEQRAIAAEQALYVARALIKYPALAGFEDLLTGEDETTILEKAERLSKLGSPEKEGSTPEPTQPGTYRAQPDLRPAPVNGAGAQDTLFDAKAVAAKVRR